MTLAYAGGDPNEIQQVAYAVDIGHQILHWMLTHVPGGVWTVIACAGLGLLFVLAITLRKRLGKFLVPILQALLVILSGKDDK